MRAGHSENIARLGKCKSRAAGSRYRAPIDFLALYL
jgi:hypothetical protein